MDEKDILLGEDEEVKKEEDIKEVKEEPLLGATKGVVTNPQSAVRFQLTV